jgi:hypothetical protein
MKNALFPFFEGVGAANRHVFNALANPRPGYVNESDGSVGIIGKAVGELGLDLEGRRAATSWEDAWRNTVDPAPGVGGIVPLYSPEQGEERSFAVPGLVRAPFDGFERAWERGDEANITNPDLLEKNSMDSFDAAGGAMTGGLAATAMGAGTPKNAVGIFGGRLAKTADHAALGRAEELAAQGAPREQIWNDTGWFQGSDGKWRFEIDDSGLRVQRGEGENLETGAIQHPELAAAYPEQQRLIDSKVGFWPEKSGSYGWPDVDDPYHAVSAYGPTDNVRRKTGAHELQHFVQNVEGFSEGQSPTAFSPLKPWKYLQYRKDPREVEARNVEHRLGMTPEERRSTPPWLTQDMPAAGAPEGAIAANGGRRIAPSSHLPMDDASRLDRAKELGFDVEKTWYHGTGADSIESFDLGKSGSMHHGGHPPSVLFTPDEGRANWYRENSARKTGQSGHVVRAHIRPGNQTILDASDPNVAENLRARLAAARDGGSDSVILRNHRDTPLPDGTYPDELFVFNPKDIRSVDAAFDPAKSDSANLLYSNSPQGASVPLGLNELGGRKPLRRTSKGLMVGEASDRWPESGMSGNKSPLDYEGRIALLREQSGVMHPDEDFIAQTPFDYVQFKDLPQDTPQWLQTRDWSQPKEQAMVDLSSLKTEQPGVNPFQVARFMDGNPYNSDLPAVYRLPTGEHILRDGNHRMSAAALRGDKEALADIFYANAPQGASVPLAFSDDDETPRNALMPPKHRSATQPRDPAGRFSK